MNIKDLVEKYRKDRAHYQTARYNETLLRSDFLDPLFELFGWDIKNAAGKSTNEREVILEESLKSSASEHSKKPDYTFRLFSERKFFLEAKKPCVAVESSNEAAKQLRRYGFTAKLKISVLSNFEYLLIYDTSIKVEESDHYNKGLIKKYHYSEFENKFDEINRLIGRESVYSEVFESEWREIENKLNSFSIDILFLQQFNNWRKLLGEEIFKLEPSISEQQLNDVVQSYLNRILFLRVCEDRNLEEYQTLLKYAHRNDFRALIFKFELADKKYNSGLFDQLLKDKIIENISSAFWVIIKELYFPQSPYSFSVFSSDILGSIYEIFLSEKLIIKDDSVELIKKAENIDRDIVTTPTFIISSILRNTVLPLCFGKTDDEIFSLKFGDIACGSGAFLLELFQLLNDILIDYYLSTDKAPLVQTGFNTFKLPFKLKKRILIDCIYGVDKDFNAVEAAKFGLLLKLLEGESIETIKSSGSILPDLSSNLFFGNSLISPQQLSTTSSDLQINPFDFGHLTFDAIVGNPPYMKSEDMKNITPLEAPIYKMNFESAFKQFDKYFLFIEQGLNLLKEGGVLGYIVPSKFTKVGAGQKLRQLITQKGALSKIISFGANQVFADKTTYTCLLFLTKKPQEEFQYSEVNNLKAWQIRDERSTSFNIKRSDDLDSDVWVLVPAELNHAYNRILSQSIRLADMVGKENIFNGIQTSANDTYIFVPKEEDDLNYVFLRKGKLHKIEKEITKPYFKTSGGVDNLNTYRTFKPNSRVIYPYTYGEKGAELISLQTMSEQFPNAFNYLMEVKDVLNDSKRDIKPTPKTKDEWHRYGRPQGLNVAERKEKIILGVLSNGDKYAIDKNGTLFTSGGTAGYCAITLPPGFEYSIYYVQAILNSKYVEWFTILMGEVFRGGYFARGTKVLNSLPIRRLDFSNKDDLRYHEQIVILQIGLIAIQDEMDKNLNNKRILTVLQGQFNREKEKLNQVLMRLYDLGNEDKQIPLIKEFYEVN